MDTTCAFIQSYTHNGRIGVLVEFAFELSVTANEPVFVAASRDIAMHIAALAPANLDSLLAQPFVKDGGRTVAEFLVELSAAVEDQVSVRRFVRWARGSDGPIQGQPDPPNGPAVARRAAG